MSAESKGPGKSEPGPRSFGHAFGPASARRPPRPDWYGGKAEDPTSGVLESWRRHYKRTVLDVVLEPGRLSWSVRRKHWTWRADFVTCPEGWKLEDAMRAAEAAADLHPANNETWRTREDGVRVLEER